jgi:hypothetical protein
MVRPFLRPRVSAFSYWNGLLEWSTGLEGMMSKWSMILWNNYLKVVALSVVRGV